VQTPNKIAFLPAGTNEDRLQQNRDGYQNNNRRVSTLKETVIEVL
jgi:hypothetical protein